MTTIQSHTAVLTPETMVFRSVLDFTWLMFRVNMRNLQGLVISLGAPLGIMAMFLLMNDGPLSPLIVPMLFLLSITFAGSVLAVRIIFWREQQVFRRLAITATPLPYLIGGLVGAQLTVAVVQALLLLLLVVLAGVTFTAVQLLVCVVAIGLACFCFTAFGPLLATVFYRADLLNYAYVLLIMPVTFFSFFGQYSTFSPALALLHSLLPTTMLLNLLNVLNEPVGWDTAVLNALGLTLYGLLFLFITARRYRRFFI